MYLCRCGRAFDTAEARMIHMAACPNVIVEREARESRWKNRFRESSDDSEVCERTVSDRNRVAIPIKFMRRLGIEEGQLISISMEGERIVLERRA